MSLWDVINETSKGIYNSNPLSSPQMSVSSWPAARGVPGPWMARDSHSVETTGLREASEGWVFICNPVPGNGTWNYNELHVTP